MILDCFAPLAKTMGCGYIETIKLLSHMLAKKERLTRKEFDFHFKQGKRFHGEALQLILSPSQTFHGAVVVGKKVYSRAVDRNRVRRSLYPVLAQYGSARTYTCIIIAKPALKKVSLAQVREELRGLLATSIKPS